MRKEKQYRNDQAVESLLYALNNKMTGKDHITGKVVAEPQPIEFDYLGAKVTLEVMRPDYGRGYRRKKSSLYVGLSGESIWDNLMNRRNRPTKLYKLIAEEAFAVAGITEEMYGSLLWSQYAGCSCPCSPGFKVGKILDFTFYLTIKVENKQAQEQLAKQDKDAPNPQVLLISDEEKAMMERTPLHV